MKMLSKLQKSPAEAQAKELPLRVETLTLADPLENALVEIIAQ